MIATPIKYILTVISLSALFACTKVIDLDLDNTTPKIVIEGIVTNTQGPYQVKISTTVNFTASNTFPPVTGATVTITDNTAAITDVLSEVSPGTYSTKSIQGIPGHSYALSVLASGQVYTAVSAMPLPINLDSLTFETVSIFGSTEISVMANYQDPAGTGNWYSFTQFVNNRRLEAVSIFDDRLSDGLYIRDRIFSDSTYIQPGDMVSLQMNCIDRNVWSYFNTLGQATGGTGFESAAPANPTGNISNKALGYFSAQTVQTKKAIAP